jgi:hypothetical protein
MKPLLLATLAALCFSCAAFAQQPTSDDNPVRKAAIAEMVKRLDSI